ncbi:hypothetical protein [Micromonospora coerulea]|uniref:hypothetical protein n=1 Tax=Micromonospora coerulea TaxID=47856 RepID=UPI00190785B2|nr:hypothetical protein [Micromonospora veneta]
MSADVHPSSSELLTALHEPDRAASTLEHLEECLACRVRLSRVRRASDLAPPPGDSLQRIVEASTPLPQNLADLVSDDRDGEPQPNEIWRVGRDEALLVWVRRVFEDAVADVIPLVLDVELADQESVIVGASATPLATAAAAIVALRTHIHTGAFLNRVGVLDIGKDVTEVMTAVREGRRPSGVRVGPPINDDDDQRLEYRQALRDFLAELSPSAWLETQGDRTAGAEQRANESTANHPGGDINAIKARLGERLSGVRFIDPAPQTVAVNGDVRVTSILKVLYLDTAILVATLHGGSHSKFPDPRAIAAACQAMTLTEADVDAVAVAIPRQDWPAQLFTTAHMRAAFEVPRGTRTGPTTTLAGYGLVDTLCKHLDAAVPAWEVTEPASSRIGRTDIHEITARHARTSIGQIATEGQRARQAAKRAAWGELPAELDERVAKFVVAVINNEAVEDALTELVQGTGDD